MTLLSFLGCLGVGFVLGATVLASDWPQWLGPERSGVSTEKIRSQLPADGFKALWSVKVGSGWSGPVVAEGRVLLHHRRDAEEVLEAWEVATGKPAWRTAQPTHYEDSFGFDNGPRGTPCITEGQVLTFGAEGRLTSVRLKDGTVTWTRPLGTELKAEAGFFGFACSPLVVSNRVIVQLGGAEGAGIVALNLRDGSLSWKATTDEASYASPVTLLRAGKVCVVAFTRTGLVMLDGSTGLVLQKHPWRPRMNASVNAATPIVWGEKVWLSTSYDTGAILLDLAGAAVKSIWENDESISAHYASGVRKDGLVFGYHGRQEQGPVFRCIDLATGKVQWSESGSGGGSVLRASDNLILLRDSGELQLAPADGKVFRPTARVQVLGTQVRAAPALANGTLYARDRNQLVAWPLGE